MSRAWPRWSSEPRVTPAAGRAIRICVVPTAAARYSPAASAAHGVGAFERVAAQAGIAASATPAMIVDAASAADADIAGRLADADLVYFPGGDPDRIPSVLRGSLAWAAIVRAHEGGAVLGGASAGAMAMAPWTWTPAGGTPGLDVVPGIAVRPHADAATGPPSLSGSGRAHPPASGSSASRSARPRSRMTRAPTRSSGTSSARVRSAGRPARGGSTVVTPPGGTFTTPR